VSRCGCWGSGALPAPAQGTCATTETDSQTEDEQTARLPDCQTVRQIGTQSDRHTGMQPGRRTESHAQRDRQAGTHL
jgi:hypothetical protein